MITNLFTRPKLVSGRAVREPTLAAVALAAAGFAVLVGACGAAIFALAPFGHGWCVFAVVAAVLAWLGLGRRRRPAPAAKPPTGRRLWLRRVVGLGRNLVACVLAGWLGLIAWSELCPGGPTPPPKADPESVR